MGFDLETLINESGPSMAMDGVADKGEAFVPCMLTYAPYLRIRPHVQRPLESCRIGETGGMQGRKGVNVPPFVALSDQQCFFIPDVAVPWLRLVEALFVGQELWGRRDDRGLSGADRRAIRRTIPNEGSSLALPSLAQSRPPPSPPSWCVGLQAEDEHLSHPIVVVVDVQPPPSGNGLTRVLLRPAFVIENVLPCRAFVRMLADISQPENPHTLCIEPGLTEGVLTLTPTASQWMQVRVLDMDWSQPEEVGASDGQRMSQFKSFHLTASGGPKGGMADEEIYLSGWVVQPDLSKLRFTTTLWTRSAPRTAWPLEPANAFLTRQCCSFDACALVVDVQVLGGGPHWAGPVLLREPHVPSEPRQDALQPPLQPAAQREYGPGLWQAEEQGGAHRHRGRHARHHPHTLPRGQTTQPHSLETVD